MKSLKRLALFAVLSLCGAAFCGEAVPPAKPAEPAKQQPAALTEKFKQIKPQEIEGNPFNLIGGQWMLITAGNETKYNSMTASWGGFGMWNKPVAFILVHRDRYTYEFLEREQYFTLTFFEEKYRPTLLNIFGKKSGRDTDKTKISGFTPLILPYGIAYEEARMIIVCKKRFADPTCPDGNCHKLYFGDILEVWVRK